MKSKTGLILASIYVLVALIAHLLSYQCLSTSGTPGDCNTFSIIVTLPLFLLFDPIEGYLHDHIYKTMLKGNSGLFFPLYEFWYLVVLSVILVVVIYFLGSVIGNLTDRWKKSEVFKRVVGSDKPRNQQ